MDALLRGRASCCWSTAASSGARSWPSTTSSRRSCASSSGPAPARARSSTWAIPTTTSASPSWRELLARAYRRSVPGRAPARFARGHAPRSSTAPATTTATSASRTSARRGACWAGSRAPPLAEMLPAIVRRLRGPLRRRASLRRPQPAAPPARERRCVSLVVVIPAYNAARHLPGVIERVLARRAGRRCARIVVVDDGSRDDTARAWPSALAAASPRLQLIERRAQRRLRRRHEGRPGAAARRRRRRRGLRPRRRPVQPRGAARRCWQRAGGARARPAAGLAHRRPARRWRAACRSTSTLANAVLNRLENLTLRPGA